VVQAKTVADELNLGRAQAAVLHVHEHEEQDHGANAVVPVDQVQPVRVDGQYDDSVQGNDGGYERPPMSVLRGGVRREV